MSNIQRAFDHGKAFIAFITCGDPDLETTAKVVAEAVANGVDLIELGIPFSSTLSPKVILMPKSSNHEDICAVFKKSGVL